MPRSNDIYAGSKRSRLITNENASDLEGAPTARVTFMTPATLGIIILVTGMSYLAVEFWLARLFLRGHELPDHMYRYSASLMLLLTAVLGIAAWCIVAVVTSLSGGIRRRWHSILLFIVGVSLLWSLNREIFDGHWVRGLPNIRLIKFTSLGLALVGLAYLVRLLNIHLFREHRRVKRWSNVAWMVGLFGVATLLQWVDATL
ncbi:MAG: hypothetical protein KDB53_01965, partial [Planctomycetes bacterium]|nr:hypothetical protein [Planctomycetota bacterium]